MLPLPASALQNRVPLMVTTFNVHVQRETDMFVPSGQFSPGFGIGARHTPWVAVIGALQRQPVRRLSPILQASLCFTSPPLGGVAFALQMNLPPPASTVRMLH